MELNAGGGPGEAEGVLLGESGPVPAVETLRMPRVGWAGEVAEDDDC